MSFDININLKWFHGIPKPKKSTIIFGNKNMLNWVLLIKLFKFNYTLTSKRDNLTFHATYET